MSYDITVGDVDFNVTFNLSALFYDHIPVERNRGGLHELDGLTGSAAASVLGQVFGRIDETRNRLWKLDAVGEPEFCAKYDAPNGWGSAIGGIIFLAKLMAACRENPRSKVRVSA